MKYLGLDLGTKTLGLAISDALGIIATSLKTINYTDEENLISSLKEVILLNKIDVVVLGLPKNMDNSLGKRAEETLKFKEKLEKDNIVVELQDERLSTKSAEEVLISADMSRKKRKKIIDKVAATVILQNYLDKINNGGK